MKKIKIKSRKLGREGADAQVFLDYNLIEIDPRLSPKKTLSATLHELCHIAFPDLSEKQVLKAERIFFNVLWDLNYRKVDQ